MLTLFTLFVAACSAKHPVISPDVSTRDIRVAVRMDPTTGGWFEATLTGPGGDVVLLAPDRLLVAQNGREWPLVHVAKKYVADIDGATGSFFLRLDRQDDASVDVGFAIPGPFAVVAPALVSRAVGMTFTWDGQVDPAETSFAITGDCLLPLGRVLGNDTGTYTLNPAELRDPEEQVPQSCTATLTITRKVSGGRASIFNGFSTDFIASSSTTFTCVP